MRTSFRHQSEAQPPNGPLTAATSPDTPSTCPARQSDLCELRQYLESGRSTWISEGTGSRLPACPSANGGRRKTWRLFGPTRRALGRALRLDPPPFFPARLRLCLSNYCRPANVRCQAREHHSIRCLAPKKRPHCPRARSASLLAQPPAAGETQAYCVARTKRPRSACESKRRR
jgi:hypothetical protein